MVCFPVTFEAIIAIVLSYQTIISFVRAEHFTRLNITRQAGGDLVAFEDKIDCGSLNAECLPKDEHICRNCKCSSMFPTYVLSEKQCININGFTTLNCRTLGRKMPLLEKSTKAISRPIRAYDCKIKEKHPELYSHEDNYPWTEMTDVDFSLKLFERDRAGPRFRRNWNLTFENSTIAKMLTTYPGRIVRFKLSCKMRPRHSFYTDWCIIFKIAGSVIVNSTIARYDTSLPASPHPATLGYVTAPQTTMNTTQSGDNTVKNQKSKSDGKKIPVIWIIIAVSVVVLIILVAVVVCICFKRRKTKQSNVENQRRNIMLHEYDVPAKSLAFHGRQSHEGNPREGEHVYATISEMQNANLPTSSSPMVYQELKPSDRENDVSHYQPLVRPELQYVDVLADQEGQ